LILHLDIALARGERGTLPALATLGQSADPDDQEAVQEDHRSTRAVLADVVGVIEQGRSVAARTVNAVMTAAYWLIGRRIVETE
jgi:phage replication-related protein YjqB (UPF0714/DUF867 family)